MTYHPVCKTVIDSTIHSLEPPQMEVLATLMPKIRTIFPDPLNAEHLVYLTINQADPPSITLLSDNQAYILILSSAAITKADQL